MIVRTVHNKENPYFQINRAAVSDDRLSYKAVGIHTYLMSKPDGWEANESDITTRHNDGRSSVRSGIQELIEYGYMVRVQLRQNKKVVGWRLDTYETPDLNPHFKPSEKHKVVVIDLDSDEPQDLECENLNVGSDTVGDLECENLDVENLDLENRTHSKYIYIENNEYKRLDHTSCGSAVAQPVLIEDVDKQPATERSGRSKRGKSKGGKKEPTPAQAEAAALTKSILEAYVEVRGSNGINYGKEGTFAKKIVKDGFGADMVQGCYQWLKADQFWEFKPIGLSTIYEHLPEYKAYLAKVAPTKDTKTPKKLVVINPFTGEREERIVT